MYISQESDRVRVVNYKN